MNKDILWLMLLHRLLHICFQESELEKRIANTSDFSSRVIDLANQILPLLHENGIAFNQTNTRSTFENIEIHPQNHFYLTSPVHILFPHDLLLIFPNADQYTIHWGALGRTFLPDRGKFVLEGLECGDNEKMILLDFPSLTVLGKEALCFRLVHELLHTTGLDEEGTEPIQEILTCCVLSQFQPFITDLFSTAKESEKIFCSTVKRVGEMIPDQLNEIFHLSSLATSLGFPAPPDEIMFTTTYHPLTTEPIQVPFF